jgi:hypothetical protein
MDNHGIYAMTGKTDRFHPDLICLAYDPSITPESVVRDLLAEEHTGRINYLCYADIPDFSQKEVPQLHRLTS